MAKTTIQIRADAEVKAAADSVFNKLGITMSDGINIFLRQVHMHGGFPFEVKLPASAFDVQSRQKNRQHIQSLCGKYKESKFSTKRYFEQKHRDKELDK